mgnify:CR=1 FL=1
MRCSRLLTTWAERNIGWVTVARETGPEYDAEDRWAIMSKRFQNWAKTWIEDNIIPGNPDIESYDARARRLMDEMYAAAAAAKFSDLETAEERGHLAPLVLATVADDSEFDYDTFTLNYLLSMEMGDGD